GALAGGGRAAGGSGGGVGLRGASPARRGTHCGGATAESSHRGAGGAAGGGVEPMKLARSLLRAALATLPLLDEEARAPAFAAIDGFRSRPAPSTHLHAVRVLSELRKNARRSQSRVALAVYARDRALDKLSQVASGLAGELPEVDPAWARRLEA